MTRAEIKKMETERKYDFISNVYNTILKSIPLETRGHRKKFEVRIVHQNYNRYVRFHSYGQDMAFQIFGDGNLAIEMKEACHSNLSLIHIWFVRERLYRSNSICLQDKSYLPDGKYFRFHVLSANYCI